MESNKIERQSRLVASIADCSIIQLKKLPMLVGKLERPHRTTGFVSANFGRICVSKRLVEPWETVRWLGINCFRTSSPLMSGHPLVRIKFSISLSQQSARHRPTVLTTNGGPER